MKCADFIGRSNLNRNLLVVLMSVGLLTVCTEASRAAQVQDSQTQQNQSVADAARRNREQKKNARRPSKVITNDDLDTECRKSGRESFDATSPVAQQRNVLNPTRAAGEAANQAPISVRTESQLQEMESEEAAAEDAEIAKLRERLDRAQDDLKWQQREFLLDQQTIYSRPNYTNDHVGKAKLDSEQFLIDEKKQEIERLRGPLGELEWRRWRRLGTGPPPSTSLDLPFKN